MIRVLRLPASFVVIALVVFGLSACKGSSPVAPTPTDPAGIPPVGKDSNLAWFNTLNGIWQGDKDLLGGTSVKLAPDASGCWPVTDITKQYTIEQNVWNPRKTGRSIHVYWQVVWSDQIGNWFDNTWSETSVCQGCYIGIYTTFAFSKAESWTVLTSTAVLVESGGDLPSPRTETKEFRFCRQ